MASLLFCIHFLFLILFMSYAANLKPNSLKIKDKQAADKTVHKETAMTQNLDGINYSDNSQIIDKDTTNKEHIMKLLISGHFGSEMVRNENSNAEIESSNDEYPVSETEMNTNMYNTINVSKSLSSNSAGSVNIKENDHKEKSRNEHFTTAISGEKHINNTKKEDNDWKAWLLGLSMDIDEELALKRRCHYRKSCYESGIIPKLRPDIFKKPTSVSHSPDSRKVINIERANDNKDAYQPIGVFAVAQSSHQYMHHKKQIHKRHRTKQFKKTKKGKIPMHDTKAIKKFLSAKSHSLTVQEMKAACKYRKSCYQSGVVPNFKEIAESGESTTVFQKPKLTINQIKLQCHYRKSCYTFYGLINFTNNGKETFIEENEAVEKVTSYDIAKSYLEEVIHTQEEAILRATYIVNPLDQLHSQLALKNHCRYRKSCYKSGITPILQPQVSLIPSFEVPVSEIMDDETAIEQPSLIASKHHCRYRKSCYKTGIIPDLSPKVKDEIQIIAITTNFELPLQLRCRYRKSCYETGVLPQEFFQKEETTKEQILAEALPTTIDELRLYCHYRKSCYEQFTREQVDAAMNFNEVESQNSDESNEKDNEEHKEYNKEKEHKEVHHEKMSAMKLVKAKNGEEEKSMSVQKTKKQKKHKVRKAKIDNDDQENKPVVNKEKNGTGDNQRIAHTVSKINNYENGAENIVEETKGTSTDDDEYEIAEQHEVEYEAETTEQQIKTEMNKDIEEEEEEEEEDAAELLKKKVKCHYRISCYIQQDIKHKTTATDQLVFVATSQIIAQHLLEKSEARTIKNATTELEEEDELTMKVRCRYRKSCYESGIIPQLQPHIFKKPISMDHITNKLTETTESVEEETAEQMKIRCRYRKSCYLTGILPNLTSLPPVVKYKAQMITESRYETLELKCRYRKSCYETQKLPDYLIKQPKETIDAFQVKPTTIPDIKAYCRYKKSCYERLANEINVISPEYEQQQYQSGTQESIEVTVNAPNVTIKCNKYRLSCRERMGLSAKEKTPIGPNGKKLCRKRKPASGPGRPVY